MPPHKLHPLANAQAFLTRSRATPRESVVGVSTIFLAVFAVVGVLLVWLMKRALLD